MVLFSNVYTSCVLPSIPFEYKKLKNKVHEKGYRGKPLTDKQKAKNTVKSKSEQE
jgi:hypothetical protein